MADLKSLNPQKFGEFMKSRAVNTMSASPILKVYEPSANRLARLLHPEIVFFTVSDVVSHFDGAKSYILKVDETKSETCPYFSAGQCVSLIVDIDGKYYSRPYTISSAPSQSLKGEYRITIKSVEGGIVSNYILNNFEVGTSVITSAPAGNFTYEPLRDTKEVLGIAGGSGITPFMSLVQAIAEGEEDFSLTLLYGCKNRNEIIFKGELDKIANSCNKFKVIYVLSEENCDGFEKGLIDRELIKKYLPDNKTSVFICGSRQMQNFVKKELETFNLERKYIRCDLPGELIDPTGEKDYPKTEGDTVTINVKGYASSRQIEAQKNESILRALEKASIAAPSACRSGECGFCRSILISGDVYIPEYLDNRRLADFKFGYIHPCCTYPLTDIEIEVFTKV